MERLQEGEVEVLERETVYAGYFRVDRYRLRHQQFRGGLGPVLSREVLERGHAAAVLPVDVDRDEVVLIEQFRPGALAAGWAPWLLECVAGIVEAGETTAGVAVREAVEEAGCRVTALHSVARFLSSPGACSETVEVFCGRTDASTVAGIHGLAHEGEDIRVRTVPVKDALRLLAEGRVVNAKTLIALQWLQGHYERLKDLWSGPHPETLTITGRSHQGAA